MSSANFVNGLLTHVSIRIGSSGSRIVVYEPEGLEID